MSKLSTKVNETAFKELMVSIRRNAQESACINNFENLLKEVDDPEFINTVLYSMHNFLTEFFELLGAVEKVPEKKFRSKMLDQGFIQPQRFFGKVRKLADDMMLVRSTLEYAIDGEYSGATRNTWRVSVRATESQMTKILNTLLQKDLSWEELQGISRDELMKEIQGISEWKEIARKEMLIWNYIPGVIKALIQTKRREMGMDNNSKHFN